MIRVLLISHRYETISKYGKIVEKLRYDFVSMSDERLIIDYLNAAPCEIIIADTYSAQIDFKHMLNKLKPLLETSAVIFITPEDFKDRELMKLANGFITENANDELICGTINMNLRMRSALEKLSGTNKDLADSNYRLNALYSTSSQFAGTLDKEKLIHYMMEGMDKALSYSLICVLSFCTNDEPVLIINSLYELSEELVSSLKLRMIIHYKSLFENRELPYQLDTENLVIKKTLKFPANRFNFGIFQFDNMFAPISLGDNFFGCVEIFKENPFSPENATCFQTIAQQVALPLKSATLYQELKESNHKLERLERLKSEFISIVSHELRTPLTSIKNALDIMLSGKCGELTTAFDKFLTMAKRNSQRLSGIINDLLDLSKIEAGKMDYHFKNMNINSVIEYVTSTLSVLAKDKGLTIQTNEGADLPEIFADSQRLEQVLTNLISNAIKFTPEGRSITVTSELINAQRLKYNECFESALNKLDGYYILVSVKDEGIGIEGKNLLHVFDKFAQIENSLSRKVGGSGLGLPIAKQLVEAHKGAIWCDSEPEIGSTFYFAVPVAKD